jgi:hypothetical protein
MHLWDRLLPQADITLNMLRTSIINPKLSAATHIFVQNDFNRAPIAHQGTILIAHETPSRRRSWDPHGKDGLYWSCPGTLQILYGLYHKELEEIHLWKQLIFCPKKSLYHFL